MSSPTNVGAEIRFHDSRLIWIEETIGIKVNSTSGIALGARKKTAHAAFLRFFIGILAGLSEASVASKLY